MALLKDGDGQFQVSCRDLKRNGGRRQQEQGISNMSVCVKVCVVETSEPHCVDTQKWETNKKCMKQQLMTTKNIQLPY